MANRLRCLPRSQCSQSLPMAGIQQKLTLLDSRLEQLKTTFNQLESQIKFGLLEAEDVFSSLAIPLMNLVGLKTVEMAEEGRFSSILFSSTDSQFQRRGRDDFSSETTDRSPRAVEEADQSHKLEDERYTTTAMMVGKKIMQKQKVQLTQLVHLLREIETEVNSSQDDILRSLADHQVFIHKFFQRAINYISAIHHSNQNNLVFVITLKLLKAALDNVHAALSSVEGGVKDLIHSLAEQMCTPMVDFAKGLKAEMTAGACPCLLAMVEEMGGAMKDRRLELEAARKKARIEEESKLQALIRLKESEEIMRKMKERLRFLEAKEGSVNHLVPNKMSYAPLKLSSRSGQAKDEKLLWELLEKKRKTQTPDSPVGAGGLLCVGSNNNNSRGLRSSISKKPPIRTNKLEVVNPHTPCLDYWLPLGSSPTVANQQVLLRKRIVP